MKICRRLLSAAVVCVALVATSNTAKAEIEFHDTFPFSFTEFNQCTGEDVMIVGEVHLYLTIIETNDGTIRLMQNLNSRGWGLGSNSGAVYRFGGNLHYSEVDPTGIASTLTSTSHRRLIGLGKTPNQRMVSTYHFEVDEFGVVTEVSIIGIFCHGD